MIAEKAGDFALAQVARAAAHRVRSALDGTPSPSRPKPMFKVRPSTPSSLANQRKPSSAAMPKRLVGDRPFRRPQAPPAAGRRGVRDSARARTSCSRASSGWRNGGIGQRRPGIGDAGDVGVAKQRQNRMVKRRGGDFDLPGVLRASDIRARRAPAARAAWRAASACRLRCSRRPSATSAITSGSLARYSSSIQASCEKQLQIAPVAHGQYAWPTLRRRPAAPNRKARCSAASATSNFRD